MWKSIFYSLFLVFFCQLKEVVGDVTVTQLDDSDMYVYTDGTYFGAFMITPRGVIAIDAPPSISNTDTTVTEIIASYTSKPVKWVIYSHHHLDHIGGATQFPEDAKYICHQEAYKYIAKRNAVPLCTEIMKKDHLQLKVDKNHIINLDYHGLVHSEGNLFIYVPQVKLLILVDFVFPKWGPYHSLGMQSSLSKFYSAFDIVLEYDFDYYVGGHLDTIGDKDDVLLSKQLFEDLETAVEEGLNNVNGTAIAIANGGYTGTNTFTIFRAYVDAVVDYCVDVMLNDFGWSDKLIDAGAYMDTHCFLVYEYVGVDY